MSDIQVHLKIESSVIRSNIRVPDIEIGLTCVHCPARRRVLGAGGGRGMGKRRPRKAAAISHLEIMKKRCGKKQ